MKKHRWSRERQQQFLEYLAETGNVSRAAKLVGSNTARVYAMRHNDPAFRRGWDEAEEIAADRLEAEAWRRAVEGVDEPAVNAGRLVRDEAGNAVMVRRYSDMLLLALLKAHRPARFNTRLASGGAASGGSGAAFDVRAMLLAKLAQLAAQTGGESPPLIESRAEQPALARPPLGLSIPESDLVGLRAEPRIKSGDGDDDQEACINATGAWRDDS
jgi:hypothetical protein